MMIRVLLALQLLSCWQGFAAFGQEFPRVPPTPPAKAEATFETQHGFRMELIAAEPLVVDPVDAAYDEDGRAYVVEMRDYPYPEEKNAPPKEFPGSVRLLEDRDDDGLFDHSTLFADQLAWPTSVCCYRGGVFVAAAPDIWYFRDSDGDGKADVRRKVFTGFGRYNVQAIMNSLRWSLDNRIYGAAAGNGGTVQHADDGSAQPISLTRRDFRFDPVTETIEAISGGERYGATFDDWGNRFLCNIRNPVQHVVLPLHYLARNPNFAAPPAVHDAAEFGDQLRVYRLSPPEAWREFRAQRWALEQANMPRSETIGAGFWTSSSGVSVYRGGAYPRDFAGNVFIGEVAGNLIHRQVLAPNGITFTSRRTDENTEFVRSRDNWFRPVNFINAPDGTLHVLDMYRETIEHPWSIPDDIKAKLVLSSGNDRGRIYRLRPPAYQRPPRPLLSKASTEQLVAHLESPHSWWRETAQRLLFERQDRSAVESLRQLLRKCDSAQGRLHALWCLDGLRSLTSEDLHIALQDQHPAVCKSAMQLAEPLLRSDARLADVVANLTENADLTVRFQLAFTIGAADSELAARTLAKLAARDADDHWVRAAVLSSAHEVGGKLLDELLETVGRNAEVSAGISTLLQNLATLAVATVPESDCERLIARAGESSIKPQLAFALLTGLGEGLLRKRSRLEAWLAKLPDTSQQRVRKRLANAAALANDSGRPVAERLQAYQVLAHLNWAQAGPTLSDALKTTQPREIQQVALRTMAGYSEPEAAQILIARWPSLTPPLREEAVNILLSRTVWHEALLGALEHGKIAPAQLSVPQRARLLAIKDSKLAERARQALASLALGPRKEVIDRYQAAIKQSADARRGQAVYRRECASCHRMAGEGHDVGPSLETVQHRSPQEILIHVLDPNREISPQFLDYTVKLTDGQVLTGMIAAENESGLTLRRAQKQENQLLRTDIEALTSSGKSLMPEGLEQKISPQEMFDLIAYLKQPRN
jgi:putative membrane-bound dehydrogenase-like protein